MEKFNHRSSQQAEIANFSKDQRNGEAAIASTIRVLVVDNQPIFSTGIQAILKTTTDLQIVGVISTLNLFSPHFPEVPSDVVLFSANTLDDTLNETIAAWKQKYGDCKTLVMVPSDVDVCIPQLAVQGINGCILRTEAPQQFIQAIRAVCQGEAWFAVSYCRKPYKVKFYQY